jgi:glutamate synthase domain-containing protein 3
MSGGIAYVLDEPGDFAEKRCNPGSVDLERVTEEDGRMLAALISRHVEATGSPRGKWILENWEQMSEKFVKIFPREYKRVMGIAARAAEPRQRLEAVRG